MARPRPVPTKLQMTRTLNDFPDFISAQERLVEFSEQQAEADAELRQVAEISRRGAGSLAAERAQAEAASMLANDPAVATITLPSLEEATHRFQVAAAAVQLQTDRVEQARRTAAQAIAAEALDQHRQIISNLVTTGQAFIAAHAELAQFRAAFGAASGGGLEPPIREFNINQQTMNRVSSDVGQLAQLAADYLEGR